jgi:hypothetical protein
MPSPSSRNGLGRNDAVQTSIELSRVIRRWLPPYPLPDPYRDTIPCLSSGMTAFAHVAREWGARTVGYESSAPPPSLAMRLAFLRGGG